MEVMQDTSKKRLNILNAGLAVMRAHGYNGTGIKDIVDAARVPKGSFYNYFESKEAFVIEALRQVAEGNLVQMRQLLLGDPQKPALQRLVAFFQTNVDHLKRTEQYQGGCFVGKICQEMSDTNEAIREVTKALFADYEKTFEACLQQAETNGELADEMDSRSLAVFLFSAWEGALIRMKTSNSAKPLDDFIFSLKQILAFS